jgi:hypothetical protein
MVTTGLKVKVIPDVLVASRGLESAWKFGVGEIIYLCVVDETANLPDLMRGSWTTSPPSVGVVKNRRNYPGEAMYICPGTAADVKLQFVVPPAVPQPVVAPAAVAPGHHRVTIPAVFLAPAVPAAGLPPHGPPAVAQPVVAPPPPPPLPPPAAGPKVLAEVKFSVIAPTYNFVKIDQFHYQSDDPNAGFHAVGVLTPGDVSFARVALKEVGGNNVWTDTVNFEPRNANLLGILGTHHDEAHLTNPAQATMETWSVTEFNLHLRDTRSYRTYQPLAIMNNAKNTVRAVGGVTGTVFGADRVYTPLILASKPWVDTNAQGGGATWLEASLKIPLHYRIIPEGGGRPAEADGTVLVENIHKLKVTRAGRMEVSKGGSSVAFDRDAGNVGDGNPVDF